MAHDYWFTNSPRRGAEGARSWEACMWKCSHNLVQQNDMIHLIHDDVIKWQYFPRNWPFVRGIHRSPHKGQWRGALMFSLICACINDWVNNRKAGDLRRYRVHYDAILMLGFNMWDDFQSLWTSIERRYTGRTRGTRHAKTNNAQTQCCSRYNTVWTCHIWQVCVFD